jgi:hypothetical protein
MPQATVECEEHKCCGRHVIALDVVLRLCSVQVSVGGVEKPAIAANWVTDGIDRCQVGFLKAKYAEKEGSREEYDGRLVQVVSICDKNSELLEDRAAARKFYGCCQAAFIEVERTRGLPEPLASKNIKKRAYVDLLVGDDLSDKEERTSKNA